MISSVNNNVITPDLSAKPERQVEDILLTEEQLCLMSIRKGFNLC